MERAVQLFSNVGGTMRSEPRTDKQGGRDSKVLFQK